MSKFLDENIYKIEKLIGTFIKNIILILEHEDNLYIDISIKKKNYEKFINQRYLKNNLTELKDLFKESYQDQSIMHIILNNYIIDGEKFSSFNTNLRGDDLSLEVNFISISHKMTFQFEKILEKYQIKISNYMCGNYIKNFKKDDKYNDLSIVAHNLKNGMNDNEIIVVPKITENKGFFEKFFQLFS